MSTWSVGSGYSGLLVSSRLPVGAVVADKSERFRTDWTDRDLSVGLVGSPYSIPSSAGDENVGELLSQIKLVAREALLAKAKVRLDIRNEWLKKNNRIRELHESNKIEQLGPDRLADTKKILESQTATDIERAINRYTLIKSLQVDHRTLDVLGLHGGKLFADELMHSYPVRPITETDVRSMHALIMGSHRCAGRYKEWLNAIEGADHVPPTPRDTPDAMWHLVRWLNLVVSEKRLPPVVIAAAVHAWLAHIHPFDDGNGRVARLLANIIIGAEALPPLIVQMHADRAQYIDALAISDQGGDLAPLIGVFLRIQRRAIQDMRDPDFAIKVFNSEIEERLLSKYVRWRKTFLAWLEQLGGALRLHNLGARIYANDMMTQESYARIAEGSASEGIVFGGVGNEDRYPECRAYLLIDRVQHMTRYSQGEPVLSFLRYAPRPWSTHVYARLDGSVSEIIVRPEPADGVYVRLSSGITHHLNAQASAEMVASHLASDFRGRRTQADFTYSAISHQYHSSHA